MRFAVFFLLVFFFAPAPYACAQAVAPAANQDLLDRVQQLERQLEEMRAELAAVRQALAATGSGSAPAPSQQAVASPPARVSEQVKAERSLPGLEVGPWRVVPFGTVYFNAYSNSSGTNNTDVPLFAQPGPGNINVTARQSRLGLRLEGPNLFGGKLGGLAEADFFGGFPTIGVGETFGVVRLRLAYARLDWKRTSLLAGQDWQVFAPNNPVSIASAAIPDLAATGNLWMRLPQLRVETRGGSQVKWLGQAAVLMPGSGDFPSPTTPAFFAQPGAGARARLPFFQVRAATSPDNWLGLGRPATLGASVHYGRARVSTAAGDRESDSFAAALDWSMPLLPHTTLAGEAFFGRNLAGFQGGVFQGINTDFAFRAGSTLVPRGPRAIGTRGGWTQLGFTPPGAERLTLYAGYGLDDPRNEDLVSVPVRDFRLRNQGFLFSFLHKPSAQLSWGLEFRRLETHFRQSGKRTNNHVNLAIVLSFGP